MENMDIETLKATLTKGFEGVRKKLIEGYLECAYYIAISEGKTKAEAIQKNHQALKFTANPQCKI